MPDEMSDREAFGRMRAWQLMDRLSNLTKKMNERMGDWLRSGDLPLTAPKEDVADAKWLLVQISAHLAAAARPGAVGEGWEVLGEEEARRTVECPDVPGGVLHLGVKEDFFSVGPTPPEWSKWRAEVDADPAALLPPDRIVEDSPQYAEALLEADAIAAAWGEAYPAWLAARTARGRG